jgi:hypothetical protein
MMVTLAPTKGVCNPLVRVTHTVQPVPARIVAPQVPRSVHEPLTHCGSGPGVESDGLRVDHGSIQEQRQYGDMMTWCMWDDTVGSKRICGQLRPIYRAA